MSDASNAATEQLGNLTPDVQLKQSPKLETSEQETPQQGVDLSNYRIEKLLGRGGMGEVYQAWDLHLHRHVAIKQLHPETVISSAQERLLNEARWTSRLDHPAIVRILHFDGSERIVMELVEGRTLAEIVHDRGPLPVARCLEIACQIAEGLTVAHAAGILHRDLKPENVMLTPEGQVKILDFGLAKKVRSVPNVGADEIDDTALSAAVGTPRSMSPEQAAGGLPLDTRSDLFSFGTLIYEISTGECPFLGRHLFATLRKIREYDPPLLQNIRPELPRELSELVGRLLQKDPEERPATTREVLETLRKIRVGGETESKTAEEDEAWRPQLAAERRQVTLLRYAATLAEGADQDAPIDQEVRLVLEELHASAREIIERWNGACHPLGDDMIGCFGEDHVREDDAHCAVEAGWEILRRFSERTAPRFPRLALRVAVHTDVIVIRRSGAADGALWTWESEHRSEQPWWLPWLVAVRMEQLAAPGALIVSEPTFRLTGEAFDFAPGPELDGPKSDDDAPLPLHVAAGRADQRGEPLPNGVLASLVARAGELERLERLWTRAKSGRGQVALVAGEAGIGKSRLVWALRERLGLEAPTWLMSRCTRATQNTALRPFIALLWQVLGVGRKAGRHESLRRLRQTVQELGLPEEDADLFAALLELPLEGADETRVRLDEAHRRRTLEGAAELVLALAERRPRVWWIEDIHWADPSTLELLELLLEHSAATSLFVLVSSRPRHMPRWEPRSYLSVLSLPPLDEEEVDELIRRRAGGLELPEDVKRQIRELTDGVPLYVDELTRWILQSGAVRREGDRWETVRTLAEAEIPTTLRATLMERLDQLGPAKHVAQIASVVGREFSEDRLQALVPYDGETLRRELDLLVEAELLHRRGVLRARYIFKHAFIHLMAYRSLVPEDRRRVHQMLAEQLEPRLEESRGPRPEEVAEHAGRAGLLAQAVELWLRAARDAWSPIDARRHAERAHKALERLGASSDPRIETWRREVADLQSSLAEPPSSADSSGAAS